MWGVTLNKQTVVVGKVFEIVIRNKNAKITKHKQTEEINNLITIKLSINEFYQ
jgi:hypothetical protein